MPDTPWFQSLAALTSSRERSRTHAAAGHGLQRLTEEGNTASRRVRS
jgi:hypothetical protein